MRVRFYNTIIMTDIKDKINIFFEFNINLNDLKTETIDIEKLTKIIPEKSKESIKFILSGDIFNNEYLIKLFLTFLLNYAWPES